MFFDQGDAHLAIDYCERSMAISRDIGDQRTEGNALANLGMTYSYLGDSLRAIDYLERSLNIYREIGDRMSEGKAMFNISLEMDRLGKRTDAVKLAKEALWIYEQIEIPYAEEMRQQLKEWQT